MVEEDLKLNEDEAIETIKNYIETSGKSQAQVSKEIGFSATALSNFMSKKYNASPNEIIKKIEQLVKINEKKMASPKDPEFKMTSISQQVIDIITYCHIQGKDGVAYGDAGVGKTMGIKQYKKDNPEAIVITASPNYNSIGGTCELLAKALKIKVTKSRRIQDEVIEKLTGSNRVIIVDEAQHLSVLVIDNLRCIGDECETGIVFVGNETLYLKIKGNGREESAQLRSRMGNEKKLFIHQIKREDINIIFNYAELDEESLEMLYKISQTYHGIRGASNVFVNTLIVYKMDTYSEITASKLAKIAKDMGIK